MMNQSKRALANTFRFEHNIYIERAITSPSLLELETGINRESSHHHRRIRCSTRLEKLGLGQYCWSHIGFWAGLCRIHVGSLNIIETARSSKHNFDMQTDRARKQTHFSAETTSRVTRASEAFSRFFPDSFLFAAWNWSQAGDSDEVLHYCVESNRLVMRFFTRKSCRPRRKSQIELVRVVFMTFTFSIVHRTLASLSIWDLGPDYCRFADNAPQPHSCDSSENKTVNFTSQKSSRDFKVSILSQTKSSLFERKFSGNLSTTFESAMTMNVVALKENRMRARFGNVKVVASSLVSVSVLIRARRWTLTQSKDYY